MEKKYFLSHLVTAFKENDVWYLYNWLNTENIFIDEITHPLYVFLENKSDMISNVDFYDYLDDFNYLVDNKFIVLSKGEILEIITDKYRESNSVNNLDLILMPVNQACNLNCVYCYENHTETQRMGDREIQSLISLILSNNIDNLSIDYFGGEPLLNHKFINKFNSLVIKICQERNIKFSSSMTTNGYLLNKELFLKLLKNNITNFQITIDGEKDSHDKLRPLKNGKGSFDVIFNNVKLLASLPRELSFLIILRINFNSTNSSMNAVTNIIDILKKELRDDPRFLINPHEIMDWGSKNETVIYLDKSEAKKINDDFKKIISQNNMIPFDVVNYSTFESNSCYAGRKNSFIVFPFDCSEKGDVMPIQKCTVALFDKRNIVGFIDAQGVISIENANNDYWISESPFRKKDCEDCFFILNCYGSSCPLNSIKNGFIKCPEAKFKEIKTVKDILKYINNATI